MAIPVMIISLLRTDSTFPIYWHRILMNLFKLSVTLLDYVRGEL